MNSNMTNGRINLMGTSTTPFALYEQGNNPPCENRKMESIFGGLQCYKDPLKIAFFGKDNMERLQQNIISQVYSKSGGKWKIGRQDCDVLTVIMRGIFLQYSANLPTNIPEQVAELNKLVLHYAVPRVLSHVKAHVKYLDDVGTLVTPISHPVSTYTNHKSLEFKGWF